MVKVITGLRRCGKSYLLGVLYKDYLLADGVGQDHIIEVALDEPGNYKYHNPLKLEKHLKRQIKDNGNYYVFIDEVQFVKRVKVRDPELEELAEFGDATSMSKLAYWYLDRDVSRTIDLIAHAAMRLSPVAMTIIARLMLALSQSGRNFRGKYWSWGIAIMSQASIANSVAE